MEEILQLLNEIRALQSKNQDSIYPEGIFPSQRKHSASGISRVDDNCFFTALIVFTLQRLKKYFTEDELVVFEGIKSQAIKAFPRYMNKGNEVTYNFWRAEKHAHFPNGKIFSRFDFLRLADDADCTALVYLAKGYTSGDIMLFKNKLKYHAGLPVKVSKNTLPQYRNLKMYSTWFGKYIPIETDICVISNILYILIECDSINSEYEHNCIKFISSVVNNSEYLTSPFRVSPYYPNTSIIIYHIARLLTIADHPELNKIRSKLVEDILKIKSGAIHPVEKIILNISLLWLENYKNIDEIELPDYKQFPWFIAGMLTSIENPLIRRIAPLSLFHIRFYCEAYIKTLYLEYKTEKRHRINHIK
jgi:hypothetical protein